MSEKTGARPSDPAKPAKKAAPARATQDAEPAVGGHHLVDGQGWVADDTTPKED